MNTYFTKLDLLKKKLDSHRPLPREIVANLHEDLVLRWTYNSNALEGNTLTLKETKVVLEGITIGGKSLREHFEAVNHHEAILFVEELVGQGAPLSEWDIKCIHQLILKNIDNKNAGVYRNINVTISGAEHIPPDYLHLQVEMEQFISWCAEEGSLIHPVERAVKVHGEFVKIHPFVDGNGRTARLLMNLELMKSGYPPVILPVERRLEYYQALDTAHTTGDYSLFLTFIAGIVESSFDPYWFALGIDNGKGC